MEVIQKEWGKIEDKAVISFTLENDKGIKITCLNYGGIITKIITPDNKGNYENIVIGFDHIEPYFNNTSYFGAIIGRVAGRIKDAMFDLNGKMYILTKNENNNHLHGGLKGFNRVFWEPEIVQREEEIVIQFSYLSVNGEEGYPGNVEIKVTYSLNNDNEFSISYEAISDQDTIFNITNHTYFNLSGNLKRDILNHVLKIKSDQFLELDEELIPTGVILDVTNTPFDLREGKRIKEGIKSSHPQTKVARGGYDHPFILNTHHDEEIMLWDLESGRTLTIETDEPGVVVYTGNQLKENDMYGISLRKYLGICLETQGFPDAIHHSNFPSYVLKRGKKYSSVTKYKFGIINK
ncbi:Aldose 1-epimerase [Thermoanaerobacter mathranii subsp. mathranii str. A3]|uniref:Aldose 1-epimerase n=1 Tax=Thermoanaerobacter mathranii subsp. mathranii (strain DSM 11426 / CCUG 53645 / CIP 108742 / A3) TaxID=583358 RepID=A0ABN3Z5J5_THEM3|nr:aldose epimerase family protein [Thermoanaerobacter mathranii]ADH61401.1 Aldose 1-epimerase [Thermoanaerobacter mathranii subsp. mathranii str. A3]